MSALSIRNMDHTVGTAELQEMNILTDAERQAIRDNIFATQTANIIVWEYRNSVDVDALRRVIACIDASIPHNRKVTGEMSDIDRWGENEALYRDMIGGN